MMPKPDRAPNKHLSVFLHALMFFTRIPAPRGFIYAEEHDRQAVIYLPVVGLIIGLLTAGIFHLADVVWPPAVAVLISMFASVLLTGALHEDGFADTCDGFGGGGYKNDVLAIMKDSRLGTYGALGVVLMMFGKFSALSSLATEGALWLVLVAGHALSRCAVVTTLFTHDYVRSAQSKSRGVAHRLSMGSLLPAACCAVPLVIMLFMLFPAGTAAMALLLIVLVRWWLGHYFQQRIGGCNGDCLGAIQQSTELAFYFGLLAQL